MKSKKINKLLNSIIIILIVLTISSYLNKKNYKQDKELINNVPNSNLNIYFFDVGQADSILIKQDDYEMLIDGGNKSDGENLVKYLKEELEINAIEVLVGTHPHEDHIGGLPLVINSLKVDKIYLPNVITTTKIFEELLDSIENNKKKITVPKIDEEINLNDMKFKVIYTGTDESDLNNASIVLKLSFGKTSYLFTGDITEVTEEKILSKDISADVLKIAHHGSNYSTREDFLKTVNPQYAIIEVGKDNKYNHPSSKTLEKLNKNDIKVYRTDKDGTIKLISDGENISIETIKTNING